MDPQLFLEAICENTRLTKEFDTVLRRWKTNSKRDLFDAVLQKEKDLESLWKNPSVLTFPEEWKEPPFLIPNNEKNAEVINDILRKSWEIQTGRIPTFPTHCGDQKTLLSNTCFDIHGFLKYYFDCLGILFFTKSYKYLSSCKANFLTLFQKSLKISNA